MKRTLRPVALLVCMMLLVSLFSYTAFAKETEFKGKRTFTLTADRSDVQNYISGGRSEMDIMIRASKPEWLTYGIKGVDHNFELTFGFEFADYDEYVARTTVLLGYEPAIIYGSGSRMQLCESFETKELFNFVNRYLTDSDAANELSPKDFFSVKSGELILNGKKRDAGGRINIGGTEMKAGFEKIKFETKVLSDDSYDRTVTATTTRKEVLNALEDGAEKVHADTTTYDDVITLSFHADDSADLIRKTMISTGITGALIEQDRYYDKETVQVEYREFTDVSECLTENGTFEYTLIPSEKWSLLKPLEKDTDKEGLTVGETAVEYVGRDPQIDFCYLRSFRFESVIITTDLTALSGKLTRYVDFVSPTALAKNYHGSLKKQFNKRLERGMKLEIYDESGSRHFRFSFSDYDEDYIAELTAIAVNGSCDADWSRHVFPFSRSRVTEVISVGKPGTEYEPPKKIMYRFVLPKGTHCDGYTAVFDDQNGRPVYELPYDEFADTPFSYRLTNWLYTGVLLFLIAAAALIVWLLIVKTKKLITAHRLHREKPPVDHPMNDPYNTPSAASQQRPEPISSGSPYIPADSPYAQTAAHRGQGTDQNRR